MKPVNAAIGTPYGRKCCQGGPHYWSDHIHKGVDIPAPTGTQVVAAIGGTVTDKNWGSSFGTHVVIDQDAHEVNGTRIAGGWAVYAHMSSKSVSVGQRVEMGQEIGKVGSSGNATGSHLHYETHTGSTWSTSYFNPQPFLDYQGTSTPAPTPPPSDGGSTSGWSGGHCLWVNENPEQTVHDANTWQTVRFDGKTEMAIPAEYDGKTIAVQAHIHFDWESNKPTYVSAQLSRAGDTTRTDTRSTYGMSGKSSIEIPLIGIKIADKDKPWSVRIKSDRAGMKISYAQLDIKVIA